LPVTTVQNNTRQPPVEFQLTAYPNPFTCSTSINIANPAPLNSNFTVKIYDILGKEVIDLSHKLNINQIQWTGLNFQNQVVAPGIYFVRVILKNQVQIKKIVKIH